MSCTRHFVHWCSLMVDAAPTFITTLTPIALLVLNELLALAGTVHVTVGWQTQALAGSLLVGNFLRRGFENGQFVKELIRIRQEYSGLAGPVAPGATPLIPPAKDAPHG